MALFLALKIFKPLWHALNMTTISLRKVTVLRHQCRYTVCMEHEILFFCGSNE